MKQKGFYLYENVVCCDTYTNAEPDLYRNEMYRNLSLKTPVKGLFVRSVTFLKRMKLKRRMIQDDDLGGHLSIYIYSSAILRSKLKTFEI